MKNYTGTQQLLTDKALTLVRAEIAKQAGTLVTADRDDQWQQLLNIFYEEWQQNEKEGKNLSYAEMVAWARVEWGILIPFAVLLGKYNQQVCNGGHAQYFDNGYADGKGGGFSPHTDAIPLYKQLVRWYKELQNPVAYPWKHGMKVLDILKRFRVELAVRDEDDGWPGREDYQVAQAEELDDRYFAIYEEFVASLTTWFTNVVAELLEGGE